MDGFTNASLENMGSCFQRSPHLLLVICKEEGKDGEQLITFIFPVRPPTNSIAFASTSRIVYPGGDTEWQVLGTILALGPSRALTEMEPFLPVLQAYVCVEIKGKKIQKMKYESYSITCRFQRHKIEKVILENFRALCVQVQAKSALCKPLPELIFAKHLPSHSNKERIT